MPLPNNVSVIVDAVKTVLNLAKAEYDNSLEEYAGSIEQLNDMGAAIATVEQWISDLESGVYLEKQP